jgi:hypothetical protein
VFVIFLFGVLYNFSLMGTSLGETFSKKKDEEDNNENELLQEFF